MRNLRTPIKVIIDTDRVLMMLCHFYALNRPEIEVLGVTSIFGNAGTDATSQML